MRYHRTSTELNSLVLQNRLFKNPIQHLDNKWHLTITMPLDTAQNAQENIHTDGDVVRTALSPSKKYNFHFHDSSGKMKF